METFFQPRAGHQDRRPATAYDANGLLKRRGARRQPGADVRAQAAVRVEGRARREPAASTPPARSPTATTRCRSGRASSAARART
ncbi:MAG: hypothetical protein MZV70_37330 [Desulfobacterales bacterium]|nr:hypothetical protein [Desulfobacterales bacterium]